MSKVIILEAAFREATLFNSDISNWATSKVISLKHTFDGAAAFNGGKCPFFNDVLFLFTKKAQLICCFSFNWYKTYPNGTCPRSLLCIRHLKLPHSSIPTFPTGLLPKWSV